MLEIGRSVNFDRLLLAALRSGGSKKPLRLGSGLCNGDDNIRLVVRRNYERGDARELLTPVQRRLLVDLLHWYPHGPQWPQAKALAAGFCQGKRCSSAEQLWKLEERPL
ncbi:hypothetical protein NKJ64_19165 [Mesorhizobium sp. M0062]|uniref:hypothetical protein n=1 Tax=Mesorhizobium sp. M0062 TaxID=2956867 RepID=UPI003335089E